MSQRRLRKVAPLWLPPPRPAPAGNAPCAQLLTTNSLSRGAGITPHTQRYSSTQHNLQSLTSPVTNYRNFDIRFNVRLPSTLHKWLHINYLFVFNTTKQNIFVLLRNMESQKPGHKQWVIIKGQPMWPYFLISMIYRRSKRFDGLWCINLKDLTGALWCKCWARVVCSEGSLCGLLPSSGAPAPATKAAPEKLTTDEHLHNQRLHFETRTGQV